MLGTDFWIYQKGLQSVALETKKPDFESKIDHSTSSTAFPTGRIPKLVFFPGVTHQDEHFGILH